MFTYVEVAEPSEILRNLRNAASYVSEDKVKVKKDKHMNTSTKLVLIDNIILPACRSKENVMEAPEPLLANWGMANGLSYKLDTQVTTFAFLEMSFLFRSSSTKVMPSHTNITTNFLLLLLDALKSQCRGAYTRSIRKFVGSRRVEGRRSPLRRRWQ